MWFHKSSLYEKHGEKMLTHFGGIFHTSIQQVPMGMVSPTFILDKWNHVNSESCYCFLLYHDLMVSENCVNVIVGLCVTLRR